MRTKQKYLFSFTSIPKQKSIVLSFRVYTKVKQGYVIIIIIFITILSDHITHKNTRALNLMCCLHNNAFSIFCFYYFIYRILLNNQKTNSKEKDYISVNI